MKFSLRRKNNLHKIYKNEYETIRNHFDVDFYLATNSDVAERGIDPIIHYLEHGSREGRRPTASFDPHYYVDSYRHRIGQIEPFVHYLSTGRALGFRSARSEFQVSEQLVDAIGVVPARRLPDSEDFALGVPLPEGLRQRRFPKVAAIIHAFYPELMGEIFGKLEESPCPIDIFVSTDTEAKKADILSAAQAFRRGTVEVRVAANRGRDVGPMLTLFPDVFESYEAFLHLHTKKSPHAGDELAGWRDYLIANLIGSRAIIESNLTLLDTYRKGFVFPQHFYPVRRMLNWGYDFETASTLLRRVGVILSKDMILEFPSGTMFWARTEAMKSLLSLGLRVEDFDEEAGQIDGTLAHAIERSLLYFSESQSFGWVKVLDRTISYPHPNCVLSVSTASQLQGCLMKIKQPLIAGAVSGHLPLGRSVPEVREFLFSPSRNERPRFVLLVPSINPKETFGGIATAIQIFKEIVANSDDTVDFAIVSTDAPITDEAKAVFSDYFAISIGDDDEGSRLTLIDASSRSTARLRVRVRDVYIATAWWTALSAKQAQTFISGYFGRSRRYVYLIQDYEPNFYGWSTRYALAESTYFNAERYIAIVNSEELFDFFEKSRYRLGTKFCLPYKLNQNINQLLKPERREKVILFYGRPSVHRNAFEIICDALAQWQMQNPVEAATWQILSLGESYDPERVKPVQNLSVLGKLTLEQYAYWLNRASIGISLMLSPHPSYPPLEMAEAGLMVITNDYADRHMADRFDLTALPYLAPDLLAEALEACVGRYGTGAYPMDTPRAVPKPFPFDEASRYSPAKLLAALEE